LPSEPGNQESFEFSIPIEGGLAARLVLNSLLDKQKAARIGPDGLILFIAEI
jgi:hypothetical protein